MMNLEVLSATNFIVNLLRNGREEIGENELGVLRKSLMEVVRGRISKHWHPSKPLRGSGYRCIRINGRLDPVIEKAGRMSGVSQEVLKQGLPGELTVWMDPGEVGYRFGENHGSYCVLWKKGEGNDEEPWTPSTNLNTRSDNQLRQSPTPSLNSRQSPVDLTSSRVVHNVDNSQFVHKHGLVECSIGHNVRNYRAPTTTTTTMEDPDIWLRNLTSRPPPSLGDTTWNVLDNPWNCNSRQGSPVRPKPWMSYKNMDFWTRDMGMQNQINNGRQFA